MALADPQTLERVRQLTGSRAARPGQRIQSLWSGYGEIRRVFLDGGPEVSVVVKQVEPPPRAHPRKLRSYEIESHWYRAWSGRCPTRLPRLLGTWSEGHRALFVLEDLGAAGFDRPAGGRDVPAMLEWLARFHAAFLGQQPEGLWPVGTYWHLATRPDELARMSDRRLKKLAPQLDARLNRARFQTLIHGDAKPANFLVDAEGRVAAVDFQYVGGGCGMRDVAYLLGRNSSRIRADLDHYFRALREALDDEIDGAALEAEWRGLYDTAWMDYERFLDGWR